MCHRHESRGTLHQWVGVIVILAMMLFASAIPGHARGGGRHGGGGHGFHGGHGWRGHGGHGGHGWKGYGGHGGHGWRGYGGRRAGWGGVGVTVGVGPYWVVLWVSLWVFLWVSLWVFLWVSLYVYPPGLCPTLTAVINPATLITSCLVLL